MGSGVGDGAAQAATEPGPPSGNVQGPADDDRVHEHDGSPPPGRLRRTVDWVDRNPLLVVAVVSCGIALGHAVWIWTHRRLGAYDPDEAGYLANALRFQRSINPWQPWAVVREVATTGTGPVVPVLSVPFLLLGPRDPRAAMLVQPVLMVVGAVAVAGIARRLSGPRPAIVAGLIFATSPTVAVATQSYWLGLGAATFCSLAAWALVSSERLTNRWTYAFGLCMALMALSRTMAVAFVPGLWLAGAVLAGRSRTSWVGLLRATAVAAAVMVPWWIINWSSLTQYLFSYGYGPRAELFGPTSLAARVDLRWNRLMEVGGLQADSPLLVLLWLVVIISATVSLLVAWRRTHALPAHWREGVALTATLLAGVAVLLSTSNNGVWFELPLIALLIPLLCAALSRGWAPAAGLLALTFLVMAPWTLGRSWWWIGPGQGPPPMSSHYEFGFAQYDERFAPARRDESAAAAADWWRVQRDLARELADLSGPAGAPFVVMSGNMQLLNNNQVALAAELDGRPLTITIPDTAEPDAELRRVLEPFPAAADGSGDEKVVVVAHHDHILFTPDLQVERFDELARRTGWQVARDLELPGGGTVTILRHPAS